MTRWMLLAVLSVPAPCAFAQAWLPPKGEAGISLAYQYTFVHDHMFSKGERQDRGHIWSNTETADLSYSLADRVALRVRLPYVVSRYSGPRPHQVQFDDGQYRGTFQDFRFELRVMASPGSFVVTPFAAFVLPSHDYVYFAHSAAGRDLKEGQFGLFVGRRLDPLLPDAYAQVRYGYSVVEQVVPGLRPNHSNFDFEAGYFVTSRLSLRVLGSNVWTHGGIDLPVTGTPATTPFWAHHDQLANDVAFNGGIGAGFSVSGATDVSATVFKTLSGRNTHAIAYGVSVAVSTSFSPKRILRKHARAVGTAGA